MTNGKTAAHAKPAAEILQGQFSFLPAHARMAGPARAIARRAGGAGPVQTEREQRGLRRHSPLHPHRPARPRRHSQGAQHSIRRGQPATAMFPGSALFDRNEKPAKTRAHRRGPPPRPALPPQQPPWIVAGEIVETSQLFARTVAASIRCGSSNLPRICARSPTKTPSGASRPAMCSWRKTTLYGMEVRKVQSRLRQHQSGGSHRNLHPLRARRGGPAAGHAAARRRGKRRRRHSASLPGLNRNRPLPPQYAFLEHNRQVRQKIETWQTRVRRHDLGNLDQAFQFLCATDQNVSSVHELNRWLRDRRPGFSQRNRSGPDRRPGPELRCRGVSRCRAAGRPARGVPMPIRPARNRTA
jgi:hypothetical protein